MDNPMHKYVVVPDERTMLPGSRKEFIGFVIRGDLNEKGYLWPGDSEYQREIVFLEKYFGNLLRFHSPKERHNSIEVDIAAQNTYPAVVVEGLDALLIGKEGLGNALLFSTEPGRIEFGYMLMQEYAIQALSTTSEDIFPVLLDIQKAEDEGRVFDEKKDITKRIWCYEPLVAARMCAGVVADCYTALKGKLEADELMKKVMAHIEFLNSEWKRAGVFESDRTSR